MGQRSCEENKALAHLALIKIDGPWVEQRLVGRNEDGSPFGYEVTKKRHTFHQLSPMEKNRFMVCSVCPRSGIDPAIVKQIFRAGIDALAEKVTRYNEWGIDLEVSKKNRLASQAKFRDVHKDDLAEKRELRKLERKIKQLKGEV